MHIAWENEDSENQVSQEGSQDVRSKVTKMDHKLSETLKPLPIGRVANPPENVPFIEIAHGP